MWKVRPKKTGDWITIHYFERAKEKKKEKRKEELYKIDLTDNFTPITDNGFSKTVN